jgi:hypothetical protein
MGIIPLTKGNKLMNTEMIDREARAKTIYDKLTAIREHVPKPHLGICGNFLEVDSDDLHDSLKEVQISWEDWPKYSGNPKFPVVTCIPHFNSLVESEELYHGTEDKWSGPYGELRYELLDWIIDKLEALYPEVKPKPVHKPEPGDVYRRTEGSFKGSLYMVNRGNGDLMSCLSDDCRYWSISSTFGGVGASGFEYVGKFSKVFSVNKEVSNG